MCCEPENTLVKNAVPSEVLRARQVISRKRCSVNDVVIVAQRCLEIRGSHSLGSTLGPVVGGLVCRSPVGLSGVFFGGFSFREYGYMIDRERLECGGQH